MITVAPRFNDRLLIYGRKQTDMQEYNKSKFAFFRLFFDFVRKVALIAQCHVLQLKNVTQRGDRYCMFK